MTAPDSQEERWAQYEQQFGSALGRDLLEFEARLFMLHRRWRDYDTLYSTELRVGVLNKFAHSFFHRHQQMTFECVVMGIARLTDREKSFGSVNLSIEHLLSVITEDVRPQLEPAAVKAAEKSRFTRDWRNKRFAHTDRADAVDGAVTIDQVTHEQIHNAIVAINEFVEAVHIKVGGSRSYKLDEFYRSHDRGGAHLLLDRLHLANKQRAERHERIMAGQIKSEDVPDDDDPVLKDLRSG